MTEREKMLSGETYDPSDEELVALRGRAQGLCHAFNATPPAEKGARAAILAELLGPQAARCEIVGPFWCDYGGNIEAGEGFFANYNLVVLDCARVTFGCGVLVGPNCGFYTACHPVDPDLRRTGVEYARPITVGDDVWIGAGVQVMPGVRIGAGSVVGGGSVVVHDIPPGVVAVGNPCRPVKPA